MQIIEDYLFFIPIVLAICLVYNSLRREKMADIFKSALYTTICLTAGVTAFSAALLLFMELVLS